MHSYSNIHYAQHIVPFQVLHSYLRTASHEKWEPNYKQHRRNEWLKARRAALFLLSSACKRLAVKFTETRARRVTRWLRRMWTMTQAMLPHKSASVHSQQLWQSVCVYRRKGKTHNVPGEGGKHRLMDMVGTSPHRPLPSWLPTVPPPSFQRPTLLHVSITRLLHVYYMASSDSDSDQSQIIREQKDSEDTATVLISF